MTRRSSGWPLAAWVAGIFCASGTLAAAFFAVAHAAPPAPQAAAAREAPAILIFAAASLAEPVDEIARAFSTRAVGPGERAPVRTRVRTSFAASSVLAKQIEAGAPADVFLSADTGWMDYLEQRSLLRAGTRENLL